jgi:hypothetical protein
LFSKLLNVQKQRKKAQHQQSSRGTVVSFRNSFCDWDAEMTAHRRKRRREASASPPRKRRKKTEKPSPKKQTKVQATSPEESEDSAIDCSPVVVQILLNSMFIF